MNDDFLDLLHSLHDAGVDFLVVGAHAMAVHGVPRATGDLDVWLRPDRANATRALDALRRFGAPVESLGISEADLVEPGRVVQLGLPPRRIDLLTRITGVEFDDAWRDRVTHRIGDLVVSVLDRAHLIRNKRATGRQKDIADAETLEEGADE